jgi:transposase
MIIAVVEMSQSSWLVGGVIPGIERQPRKKLEPSAERLLGLLHRWRDEAVRAGKKITRIAVAFEARRDGFWLARWLSARGVEAHVIHPSSVALSGEHRRAKTDRLDTELLKRGFLGWLRGERGHCSMARVPTIAEEDAKRPNRERECLVWAVTSSKNQCISDKVGHFFFRRISRVFGTSVPPHCCKSTEIRWLKNHFGAA